MAISSESQGMVFKWEVPRIEAEAIVCKVFALLLNIVDILFPPTPTQGILIDLRKYGYLSPEIHLQSSSLLYQCEGGAEDQ